MTRVGQPHRRVVLGGIKARATASPAVTLPQMELIDALGIAAVATDPAGTITHWTTAAGELYGRTAAEMIGAPITSVALAPEDEIIAPVIAARLLALGSWRGELEIRTAEDDPLRLAARCTVLRDRRGSPTAVAACFTAIAAHRRRIPAAPAITVSAGPGRSPVAADTSWEWDPHTDRILTAEPCTLIRTVRSGEMTMRDVLAAMPAEDRRRARSAINHLLARGTGEGRLDFRLTARDGSTHWLRSDFHSVCDEQRAVCAVRGTIDNVTASVLTGERIHDGGDLWQATLDSLSAHIAVLDERGVIVAVNERWREFGRREGGHDDQLGRNYLSVCRRAGDPAATEVESGLRELLAGERDTLELEYPCHGASERRWFLLHAARRRPGGPPGVVVAHQDVTERRLAEEYARFVSDDATRGDAGVLEDADERRAESARLRRELKTLNWVQRLQEAFSDESFVLYAQPIVDLAAGGTVQHELLLRMRLPEEDAEPELVLPSTFLPIAEEYGFVADIDRWVIDRAAELAARGASVELNVSARSISDPRLLTHIRRALARTGANPSRLVFEITETALVSDERTAREFVAELHALGCELALDDFGTGYGSLTYLKQLPIDYLKIDIEFVRDLEHDPASRNVVQAIVNLAAGFNMSTIAEGVENVRTLELLREIGVDRAQGFHLGRPAPLEPMGLR